MAKEVTIHNWCDVCMREDVRTEATTTPELVVGATKARTLDLCEVHRKELLDPLLNLLKEDGAVADKAQPAAAAARPARRYAKWSSGTNSSPGPFDCLVPGCTGRHTVANGGPGYSPLGALKSHVRYAHNLSPVEYEAQYGHPQRLSEVQQQPQLELEPTGDQFVCGIDGCTVSYPADQYARPHQALGVHRAQAHGVKGKGKG